MDAKSAQTAISSLAKGDIAHGVLAGAQSMGELSQPAQVMVSALDSSLGAMSGMGDELSKAASSIASDIASKLGDQVGSMMTDVIGDMGDMIPVVGPFIKMAVSTLSLMFGSAPTPDWGHMCQSLSQLLSIRATGSAGDTMPYDIFRKDYPLYQSLAIEGFDYYWEGVFTTIVIEHPEYQGLLINGADGGAEITASPSKWKALGLPESWRLLAVKNHLHELVAVVPLTGMSGSDGKWHEVTRPIVPLGLGMVRSMLGMALMQITEGSVIDPREMKESLEKSEIKRDIIKSLADDSVSNSDSSLPASTLSTPAKVAVAMEKAIARDNRLAPLQWAHQNPTDAKRGIPAAWSERFRKLRRAIEASGPGTDGGLALWLVYQDLFVKAIDKGYLTPDYIQFLYQRQTNMANHSPDKYAEKARWYSTNPLLQSDPDKQIIESTDLIAAPATWIWFNDPCPKNIAKMVTGLADKWRNTVHPQFLEGQKKLSALGIHPEELKKHAANIGRRRALAKTPVQKAALDAHRQAASTATDVDKLAMLRGMPVPPSGVGDPGALGWSLMGLAALALGGGAIYALKGRR